MPLPAVDTRPPADVAPIPVDAVTYAPLADLSFSTRAQGLTYHAFTGERVTYDVFLPEGSKTTVGFVKAAVERASARAIAEIRYDHRARRACHNAERVEIYEVGDDVVNDAERLRRAGYASHVLVANLLGFYDPRDDEPGLNAIVISRQDPELTARMLWHEVAHHWYSVFCMADLGRESSEDFARRIQGVLSEAGR